MPAGPRVSGLRWCLYRGHMQVSARRKHRRRLLQQLVAGNLADCHRRCRNRHRRTMRVSCWLLLLLHEGKARDGPHRRSGLARKKIQISFCFFIFAFFSFLLFFRFFSYHIFYIQLNSFSFFLHFSFYIHIL